MDLFFLRPTHRVTVCGAIPWSQLLEVRIRRRNEMARKRNWPRCYRCGALLGPTDICSYCRYDNSRSEPVLRETCTEGMKQGFGVDHKDPWNPNPSNPSVEGRTGKETSK